MAPTDEELLELMPQGFRDDLALVSRMAAHGAGPEVQPGLFRVTLNTGALDYARAVWDRARALLAQPEPEVVGPSDEDVEAAARVIYGSMRFDRIDSTSDWVPNGNSFAQDEARRCARAVLARYGRPAPTPAGEVAKLVQPPGRAGLTWQGVIEGLRDVLNDESEDAIQRVWQRSRILDAISVMEANPCPAPAPAGGVGP